MLYAVPRGRWLRGRGEVLALESGGGGGVMARAGPDKNNNIFTKQNTDCMILS